MAVQDPMKQAKTIILSNPVGAVVGAGATYLGLKKYSSVSKWWMIIGISLVGGVAGAYAQRMMKAKSGSQKSVKSIK